ncbi:MAG: hypothetical protein ACC742_12635 [Thermoanaerobaculales bacterium]
MNEVDRLQSDLSYVRDAVQEVDKGGAPYGIYFLWAVIVLAGFALVDFAPRWLSLYWGIAGPAGGIFTGWISYRAARRAGEEDRREGIRHALHWTAMFVAIALIVVLAVLGKITWDGLSVTILVVIALGYFLAGVHLERPLMWLGLLMAAGYPFVLLVPIYPWTLLGLLVAVGMVATGLIVRRGRVVQQG